ncbi:MAG: hypothetical protein WDW36_009936 [Sanguina aurantia]
MCHHAGNHYDVLGVTRTATVLEIKTAFRKLALKLHPDVNKEPAAGKQFVAVKEAYETLSDVQTRGKYDATHRPAPRASAPGPGYASAAREVQYSWEPVQRAGARSRRGASQGNRSSFESVFGFGVGVDENGSVYVEMDDEESVEEEILDSFGAWANSGARRSSFQGSFEANAKKQKRKQEAAAAAAAAQAAAAAAAQSGPKRPKPRPSSSSGGSSSSASSSGGSSSGKTVEPGMHAIGVSLEELLHSMEPMVRRTAQKVYGRRLEDLTSAQEQGHEGPVTGRLKWGGLSAVVAPPTRARRTERKTKPSPPASPWLPPTRPSLNSPTAQPLNSPAHRPCPPIHQELLDFYDTLEMLDDGSGAGGRSEEPPPRGSRARASSSRSQAPEWTAETWEAFVDDSGFASTTPSRSRSARKQAATAAGTGSPIGTKPPPTSSSSSRSSSPPGGRRTASANRSSTGRASAAARGGPTPNGSRPAVPSSRPGQPARGRCTTSGTATLRG